MIVAGGMATPADPSRHLIEQLLDAAKDCPQMVQPVSVCHQ